MDRQTVETWVERYGKAWHDKDVDGVADLFTEDATYAAHPTEEPYRGSDGIRTYWRQVTATQSDVNLQFGRPFIDGNWAIVEWWATMNDAEWGPPRSDPAVTLPGCLILRFTAEELCAELREYWNVEFGRHIPAPPTWGK